MNFNFYKLKKSTYENSSTFTFDGSKKKCKILKIYDGDTLWLSTNLFNKIYKMRIRMDGYDSPEMKPSLKNKDREEEKKAAIEAKEYLEKLILGRIVNVKFGKFDKYGRPLCTIYYDLPKYIYGIKMPIFCCKSVINVNEQMISMGYGYPYKGGTKLKYRKKEKYSNDIEVEIIL